MTSPNAPRAPEPGHGAGNMPSAYLNALREEGSRDDLLREVGRLFDEKTALVEVLGRARQFIDITRKGYEEVEIDDEMVDPYEFMEEIDAALTAARGGAK